MGIVQSKTTKRKNEDKKAELEMDESRQSNMSKTSSTTEVSQRSILKTSESYQNLSALQENDSDQKNTTHSFMQKLKSIQTRKQSDVRVRRKAISDKQSPKGVRRLKEPLDEDHSIRYKLQHEKNSYIQDKENDLIHAQLTSDIKDFINSEDINLLEKAPLMKKIGNKMLDLMSQKKYPEQTVKRDEYGDVLYKREQGALVPATQYNSANYLSVPRYFHTTEGTWNTIAMHIQSNDKVSGIDLDKEYSYTEENIKKFLGELGNFTLARTDEKTKQEMLKGVDTEGSDAERYRHFVERKAYKTVQAEILAEEQKQR